MKRLRIINSDGKIIFSSHSSSKTNPFNLRDFLIKTITERFSEAEGKEETEAKEEEPKIQECTEEKSEDKPKTEFKLTDENAASLLRLTRRLSEYMSKNKGSELIKNMLNIVESEQFTNPKFKSESTSKDDINIEDRLKRKAVFQKKINNDFYEDLNNLDAQLFEESKYTGPSLNVDKFQQIKTERTISILRDLHLIAFNTLSHVELRQSMLLTIRDNLFLVYFMYLEYLQNCVYDHQKPSLPLSLKLWWRGMLEDLAELNDKLVLGNSNLYILTMITRYITHHDQ